MGAAGSLLYSGGSLVVVLVAAGLLLPIVALLLPARLLARYGALVLALAGVASALSLSFYAFGEDDYTNDGESRWQTHNSNGSHAYYVGALLLELLLAATAAALRRRPQRLRLVAGCAALVWPFLWFGSVLAFDNN